MKNIFKQSLRAIDIILFILICTLLLALKSIKPPELDNLETAKKNAIKHFAMVLNLDRVDTSLFIGPELAKEEKEQFTFRWESKIPHPGATTIEVLYCSPLIKCFDM